MLKTYVGCLLIAAACAYGQGGVPPHLTLLPLSNNTGTNELRFRETYTNGSNYLALRAPMSLTSNITLTWPATLGGAGSVLATDAAGSLYWAPSLNSLTPTLGRYPVGDGAAWTLSAHAAAAQGICPMTTYEGFPYPTGFIFNTAFNAPPQCDMVRHVNVATELKRFQFTFTIADPAGIDFPFVAGSGGPAAWPNVVPVIAKRIKVTNIWCQVDAGTLDINILHNDGTFANTLATNLQCTTVGASSSTMVPGEDLYQPGHTMWLAQGSALTGQKWVSVAITYELY